MKKVISVFLAMLMLVTVFAGCSSKPAEDEVSYPFSTTKPIPTEKAVIKESDAVHFIENSYTKEELGLADVKDDYTFMVSASGIEIEKDKYIKVVANVMSQNDVTTDDGKVTYSLTSVGEYYISYNGKEILMKDLKTGKYTPLENRYEEYKAKAEKEAEQSTEHTHASTETEASKKK